jgi:hypothetical protein
VFTTWSKLGRELANRGTNDDPDQTIRHPPHPALENQTKWLLCAIVEELQIANRYAASKTAPAHPISDGILRVLKRETDTELPDRYDGLGMPARRILKRAGIRYLSELTESRLLPLRNCGATTCAEILKWAESLKRQTP